MIEAMHIQRYEVMEKPPGQITASGTDFAALFGDAAAQAPAAPRSASPGDTTGNPTHTLPGTQPTLGAPDVQDWLTSYYTEQGDASAAQASYVPAQGAGNNYPSGSVYGPDQIFAQALANQDGQGFATLAGDNPAEFTSQLPGIPSTQAQQQFDQRLALENLGRLQSGQPIDTTAYWSDPGPITTGGVTYTSQELGYAGPGQSSGPQPIYISTSNQLQGSDKFSVPGYNGTVSGLQPDRYYTLQQLEKAGLPPGQADGQFHPGSWTETPSV